MLRNGGFVIPSRARLTPVHRLTKVCSRIYSKNITRIHTTFDMHMTDEDKPSYRLVAQENSGQQTEIPYDRHSASPTNKGWYFVEDNTYTTLSLSPTRFIQVVGPENTINPGWFFWDPVGLESATVEKERLRGIIHQTFPLFDIVRCHYADYFDPEAFDKNIPGELFPLEATSLRDAINSGQHFVSLTGHGGWDGCCTIKVLSQPDFTNNHQYFIAFANSCYTAQPDVVDVPGARSLGERLVLTPGGGAVAYIGFTRMGFCGVGDTTRRCSGAY